MKLEILAKIERRNAMASKNFHDDIIPVNDPFIVNLEQFGSWIPEPWSMILSFSLITIFYLTKSENRP